MLFNCKQSQVGARLPSVKDLENLPDINNKSFIASKSLYLLIILALLSYKTFEISPFSWQLFTELFYRMNN